MKRRGAWRLAVVVALLAIALATLFVVVMNRQGEEPLPAGPEGSAGARSDARAVQRGRYLALAGNCEGCHTQRGGVPYAGGRGIETPFGTVYSSNLTPDLQTGLGAWTAAEFWRALHNGRSRDGRLLYPAFPYPNYTRVTREDSDAIFAFLQSLPPADQRKPADELRFPYNLQASLAVWRALFFRPGVHEDDPSQSPQWNRGSYLVRGLGHCNACHGPRNLLGATSESRELSGGLLPMQNWYAPSLASPREAGVAGWETAHVVALLRDGTSPRGAVLGPMAEVVFRSTQYLDDADLTAMAVFLKALPQEPSPPAEPPEVDPALAALGARTYEQHCSDCHGDAGQGAAPAYPALAGNRAVTMRHAANVVRVVLSGGFAPSTRGNPRPYGMPPFGPALNDIEVAAVISHIRGSWGNQAPGVSELEVLRLR